jgi:hypothetical protein
VAGPFPVEDVSAARSDGEATQDDSEKMATGEWPGRIFAMSWHFPRSVVDEEVSGRPMPPYLT